MSRRRQAIRNSAPVIGANGPPRAAPRPEWSSGCRAAGLRRAGVGALRRRPRPAADANPGCTPSSATCTTAERCRPRWDGSRFGVRRLSGRGGRRDRAGERGLGDPASWGTSPHVVIDPHGTVDRQQPERNLSRVCPWGRADGRPRGECHGAANRRVVLRERAAGALGRDPRDRRVRRTASAMPARPGSAPPDAADLCVTALLATADLRHEPDRLPAGL